MKFTLEIECDNEAFGETNEDRCEEIARILRRVAERLQTNVYGAGAVRGVVDANGNTVGDWSIHADE